MIDGGLATELSRQGLDLGGGLWSARVLIEAPDAIERVHVEYFRAGADIAITASYQASYGGFAEHGLSAESTTAALRRSVEIARSARSRVLRERPGTARELLVAASVGPYGAVLHDGSEYRGDYGLDENALVDFHRERFTVLADAGADLLACETIPSRLEAAALVRLLGERPDAKAWVTFSCRDGRHTSAGDSIAECARWLDGVPQVVAIGVNCVAPELVESLIHELGTGTSEADRRLPEFWRALGRGDPMLGRHGRSLHRLCAALAGGGRELDRRLLPHDPRRHPARAGGR